MGITYLKKGIKKLSELEIDVSKDWRSFIIRNVGAPEKSGDVYVRGSPIQLADIPSIDHGWLTGLGDDDHTQYALADRTRPSPWAKAQYKYIVTAIGSQVAVYDENASVVHGPSASPATEINWALNNLTSGRTWKEKVLIKGNFTLDDTIKVPSYTVLEVQGKLTLANGVNKNMIENSDLTGGNTQIELVGGIFDGNRANQTAGVGIYFSNVTHSRIANMRLQNVYGNGIHFVNTCLENIIENVEADTGGSTAGGIFFQNASARNRVSNCFVTNFGHGFYSYVSGADNEFVNCIATYCGVNGFYIIGSSVRVTGCTAKYCNSCGFSIGGTDVTIAGCNAGFNRIAGIYVDSSSFVVVISGCVAARNGYDGYGGYGIVVDGHDNTITGNDVNHQYTGIYRTAVGIYVTGGRNTVTGNTVYENPVNTPNTGHGIIVTGSDNVVDGNVVYNNSGDGIQINNAINNIIASNRCTTNANYGVNETGTSDYSLIHGNNLRGNTTGALTTVGTNTVVADNIT